MLRALLVSAALIASPAFADDHDHHDHHDDHHVAETDGIRAVHAWANATSGTSALVFVEIENTSGDTVILLGAETEIAASAALVGLQNAGGTLSYVVIPQMPVPAGTELLLSPNGLAIQLSGLTQALVEGEEFELELEFEGSHLDVHVEIEPASATQHSHAGHNH